MNTYNDPHHSNPHGQLPACLFGEHECKDASRETPQIVDGNDYAFKRWAGMVESIQEISIAYDSGKDTLVVAEKDECKLTRDCDGGSKAETSSIPVGIWCSDHSVGDMRSLPAQA